jgi:potassium efflux system protein
VELYVNPRGSIFAALPALIASATLSLAIVGLAIGQEAAPAVETPSATRESAGVPADQIPARASSARLALETIRSRVTTPAMGTSDELTEMVAIVDRLQARADVSRLDQLPDFRIAELGRQVEFYRRELERAESRNIARATRLSADAAEMSRLRGLWTATLAAAERDHLSRPLIDEAQSVIRQIDETEALLEQPLSSTLAVRQREGRYETRLDTLMRTLTEADDRAKARRLSRDVQPLWAIGALRDRPGRDWDAVRNRLDEQAEFSRDFFKARHDRLQAYVLIGILAFAAALWLRRKGDVFVAAGEPMPDASRVLKRPFSSLLLVLLVVVLLTEELAPTIVLHTLAMVVMLVLLRLMPSRLMAGRRILLVGLAILFVLDRARAMLPFDSALLLVAIVANVFGNISLADLLIHGTLTSTYVSAIMFAAAFIVDDFVRMMVRSKIGQNLRMVTLRGAAIAQGTEKIARFVAVLAWLSATIAAFQLWVPVSQRIKRLLETSWQFGELSFTLGGIGTFVLGVLIAVYASRTVRFLLNEEILSRVSWPPGAKSTTATLVYYGVLFGGLLLALNAAGIETSQFALIVGALGVGIGFGLQNVVNNFVSGLILMFERPIQPGDIIDIDTLQGRVIEIGLRATRVKTWEGAEVVVPNGNLLSGNLINWTLSDSSRRVELPIGVAYGSNVRRVLEILLRVATEQRDAMKDPAPNVLFVGFGESSLDLVVRFWTRDATVAVAARSEAGVAIAEALAAEGIQIPFPQRDLHIRSVDAGAAEALK